MKQIAILAAMSALPMASQAAITTGLVAYFDFETSGTTQTNRAQAVGSDVTGTLVNGGLINASTGVADAVAGSAGGRFGNGLVLTPTTTLSSSMSLGIGTGGTTGTANLGGFFTIGAWFKLDAPLVNNGSGRYFVWEDSDSTDSTPEISLEMRNGTIADGAGFQVQSFNGGSGNRTSGVIAANTWVYGLQTVSTVTVDTTTTRTITTYVNGVAIGDPAGVAFTGTLSTAGLNFGRARDGTNNRGFDGTMDDVALWNRVLSSEEITYLSSGGAIPEPATALLSGLGVLALLRRRR